MIDLRTETAGAAASGSGAIGAAAPLMIFTNPACTDWIRAGSSADRKELLATKAETMSLVKVERVGGVGWG